MATKNTLGAKTQLEFLQGERRLTVSRDFFVLLGLNGLFYAEVRQSISKRLPCLSPMDVAKKTSAPLFSWLKSLLQLTLVWSIVRVKKSL